MSLIIRTSKEEVKVDIHEELGNKKTPVVAIVWGMPLTPTEADALIDKRLEEKWVSPDEKTKKERIVDPDGLGFKHDKIKKVITRWEGFIDRNNIPISCTDENKIIVFEHNVKIINYVLDEIDKIGDEIKVKKEGDQKNLGDIASGE